MTYTPPGGFGQSLKVPEHRLYIEQMEDVSGYRSVNGKWYENFEYTMKTKYGPTWNEPSDEEFLRLFRLGRWEPIEQYLRKQVASVTPKKTFAFTFTTNLDTKLEVQKEMCYSAWKLFLQKTTPVEEGEVFLEYTEQGRPHLHGWYVTEDGGRIFAKTFRRCWSPWAEKARQTKFAGGFHELMKTNRYKGYASDEGRLIVSKKPNAPAEYHTATAEKWHI